MPVTVVTIVTNNKKWPSENLGKFRTYIFWSAVYFGNERIYRSTLPEWIGHFQGKKNERKIPGMFARIIHENENVMRSYEFPLFLLYHDVPINQ